MTHTDCIFPVETRIGNIPVVTLSGVDGFDVVKTFDCGQCFRFEPVPQSLHEAEYAGVAHGRLISVAQDGDVIKIYNATAADYDAIWRHYLGFDVDYAAIDNDILSRSDNPALARAVQVGSGIHILRQQEWETVCSFIISQNNNIPRIKKLIGALSERYGQEVDVRGMEQHGGGRPAYAFPTAEALREAGTEAIFALRTGFRAKYIYDAACKWASGELEPDCLAGLSTADAALRLECIKGVGAKVAACSLLFGFGRLDAFPVDVWIKRVIARYFGEGFTAASLGPYAGVAQQYLFYYERYTGGGEA